MRGCAIESIVFVLRICPEIVKSQTEHLKFAQTSLTFLTRMHLLTRSAMTPSGAGGRTVQSRPFNLNFPVGASIPKFTSTGYNMRTHARHEGYSEGNAPEIIGIKSTAGSPQSRLVGSPREHRDDRRRSKRVGRMLETRPTIH